MLSKPYSISITHYKRPEYSDKCMYYLSRCLDIENYVVHHSIDYYNDDISNCIVEICKKYTNIKSYFTKHETNLGVCQNVFFGYKYCFEKFNSTFCIHTDDDNIYAKDALLFYNFCAKKYRDSVMFFSAYSPIDRVHIAKNPIDDIDKIYVRGPLLEPTLGITDTTFNLLKSLNAFVESKEASHGNSILYTFEINNIKNFYCAMPYISRANNIGREGGTFVKTPEQFDKLGQHLPIWSELFKYNPIVEYKEKY